MIPSNRWFPANLGDRALWYKNFSEQLAIGTLGTSVGLPVASSNAPSAATIPF